MWQNLLPPLPLSFKYQVLISGRIPVYILNALYLAPLTLWTYLNYGRPSKPSKDSGSVESHHMHHDEHGHGGSEEEMSGHEHYHMSSDRPMFATVTVAVCHCGAGCLLGDIIGEWLVYGTGAQISGRVLWAEYLIGMLYPNNQSPITIFCHGASN